MSSNKSNSNPKVLASESDALEATRDSSVAPDPSPILANKLKAKFCFRICDLDMFPAFSLAALAEYIAPVCVVADAQASDLPCNIKQKRQLRINSSSNQKKRRR